MSCHEPDPHFGILWALLAWFLAAAAASIIFCEIFPSPIP